MGQRTRASGFAVALAVAGCELGCELVGPIPDLTSGTGSRVTDASTADASPGAAPCSGSYVYCNSFETPADLQRLRPDNVSAVVDTTVARVGAGSVRLAVNDTSRNGVLQYGPTTLPTHVFVRVLVRFDLAAGDTLSIGQSDFSDAVHAYVGAEGLWHVAKYAETDLPTTASPNLAGWNCVELELDTKAMIVNAWFDGGAPFTLTLKELKAPFDSVSLVLGSPQMRTAWFDDFVIATERIGCP